MPFVLSVGWAPCIFTSTLYFVNLSIPLSMKTWMKNGRGSVVMSHLKSGSLSCVPFTSQITLKSWFSAW